MTRRIGAHGLGRPDLFDFLAIVRHSEKERLIIPAEPLIRTASPHPSKEFAAFGSFAAIESHCLANDSCHALGGRTEAHIGTYVKQFEREQLCSDEPG